MGNQLLIGTRSIHILVDSASWSGAPVPSAIGALDHTDWSADLDAGLAQIALWKRPPTISGFHLTDMWAWLRYGRAIDPSPGLRLVEAWNHVDAHQKTLLSDDFGVGLSALLLVSRLGMQLMGETRYVVEIVRPGQFIFQNRPKQGPAKSPDYIVTDTTGNCHAVEFKGTQSTRAVLHEAVENGSHQKANLLPAVGHTLGWSLVIGVFVPQSDSNESALLRIRDPSVGDLGRLMAQIPVDEIRAAIFQITLAKCFALADEAELAAVFASPTERLRNTRTSQLLPSAVQARIDGSRSIDRTIFWRDVSQRRNSVGAVPGTDVFSISIPAALLQGILKAKTVGEFIADTSRRALRADWKMTRTNKEVTLVSPIGVTFTVS